MSATQARRVRDRAGPGPGGCFALAFVALLALLLVRNSRVFTTAVHEPGDPAANSILVGQAKQLGLLVGNYSRLGFSHPGPGFFYWQALGEYLFFDLLPVTPAPWNGQWLALLILNAALVAGALAILRSWSGSWVPVVWCGAAVLVFVAVQPGLLSSAWMPHLYTAPFLLLLVAAASVAAGRTGHLWLLALAGGLLIHGHAEFLFFVPVIWSAALAGLWWVRRRRPDGPVPRRHWLACAAVLAVFALPILLNLALHWPGEFGRYFGYGGEREAHGPGETSAYVLQFWADRPAAAWAFVLAAHAAVAVLVWRRPAGDPRPILAAGLGVAALATALFAFYATRGIDNLDQMYVGLFYRAVPLALLLLATVGLTAPWRAVPAAPAYPAHPVDLVAPAAPADPAVPVASGVPADLTVPDASADPAVAEAPGRPVVRRWRAVAPVAAVAALVAAVVVAGRSPALTSTPESLPELPGVIADLGARAAGRPVLVDLDHEMWPELTALIVAGNRRDLRVCARDPDWRFMVTAEFVCTEQDRAAGWPVRLSAQPPPGGTVLGRLGPATVSTAGPASPGHQGP